MTDLNNDDLFSTDLEQRLATEGGRALKDEMIDKFSALAEAVEDRLRQPNTPEIAEQLATLQQGLGAAQSVIAGYPAED